MKEIEKKHLHLWRTHARTHARTHPPPCGPSRPCGSPVAWRPSYAGQPRSPPPCRGAGGRAAACGSAARWSARSALTTPAGLASSAAAPPSAPAPAAARAPAPPTVAGETGRGAGALVKSRDRRADTWGQTDGLTDRRKRSNARNRITQVERRTHNVSVCLNSPTDYRAVSNEHRDIEKAWDKHLVKRSNTNAPITNRGRDNAPRKVIRSCQVHSTYKAKLGLTVAICGQKAQHAMSQGWIFPLS